MYRKEKDRGRADSRFEGKGRGELDKAGGKTKRKEGWGREKREYPLVRISDVRGSVSLLPRELCNWIGWHAQELSKFPAIFTTLTAIYAG